MIFDEKTWILRCFVAPPGATFLPNPRSTVDFPQAVTGVGDGKYRFFELFGMVRIDSITTFPAVARPLHFLNSHKKKSRRPHIFILKFFIFRKFSKSRFFDFQRNFDKIEKSCFRKNGIFSKFSIFFKLHPPGGAPSPCRAGSSMFLT